MDGKAFRIGDKVFAEGTITEIDDDGTFYVSDDVGAGGWFYKEELTHACTHVATKIDRLQTAGDGLAELVDMLLTEVPHGTQETMQAALTAWNKAKEMT